MDRQHTELWAWDGTAYGLKSHYVPPPPSDRWAVNDAEVYFRHQEYVQALPLYRRALSLPRRGGDRDWKPYVHLRLGQTLALLGRTDEARRELRLAAQAPGQLGDVAAFFLRVWDEQGLVPAFGLLMPITPGKEQQNLPFTPLHGLDLAPPAVALQTFLQSGGGWLGDPRGHDALCRNLRGPADSGRLAGAGN